MLIDIEHPTRELLQTIVDKIIIDKDKNVEIIYKFSILNQTSSQLGTKWIGYNKLDRKDKDNV